MFFFAVNHLTLNWSRVNYYGEKKQKMVHLLRVVAGVSWIDIWRLQISLPVSLSRTRLYCSDKSLRRVLWRGLELRGVCFCCSAYSSNAQWGDDEFFSFLNISCIYSLCIAKALINDVCFWWYQKICARKTHHSVRAELSGEAEGAGAKLGNQLCKNCVSRFLSLSHACRNQGWQMDLPYFICDTPLLSRVP